MLQTLDPTRRLSRRETEVLSLLCHGLIDKEVAERLGISLGTVRVYRKRMYRRMGHDSLLPAALVAWRTGQLDLEAIADWAIANQRQPVEDSSRVGSDNSRAPATASLVNAD